MSVDRETLARAGNIAELYILCEGIISKAAFRFYMMNESRCHAAGVELSDLKAEGYFAVLEAAEAYRRQDGKYKFLTYLNYPLRNRFNVLIGYRGKQRLYEPLNNSVSLDVPIKGDTEDITLLDTIEDKDGSGVYDEVADSLALSEVFPEVVRLLKDFPERYEILVKAYLENKTISRIAAETGLSASQVSTAKAEARRQLRRSKVEVQGHDLGDVRVVPG